MQPPQADTTIPGDGPAQLAAETFRMLGDPTRVKLLWALLQGESSVSRLAELVKVSPTSVSQHLAKLRLAGLGQARREGTFVYSTAASHHVPALLSQALFHADHADAALALGDDHRHPLADHDDAPDVPGRRAAQPRRNGPAGTASHDTTPPRASRPAQATTASR